MTAITSYLQRAANSTNHFVHEHPFIIIVLGSSGVGLSAMHSTARAVAAVAVIAIGSLLIYLFSTNVKPSGDGAPDGASDGALAGNGPGSSSIRNNAPAEQIEGEGDVGEEWELLFPLPIRNMRHPTKRMILEHLRHTPEKDWFVALDGALKLLEHNRVAQRAQPRHAATTEEENNTVKMIEILVTIKDPTFIKKALPLMTSEASSVERIKIIKELAAV